MSRVQIRCLSRKTHNVTSRKRSGVRQAEEEEGSLRYISDAFALP